MADAFAPQLNADIQVANPVNQPSMWGVVADAVGNLVQGQRQRASGSTRTPGAPDPNLARFTRDVQDIEAQAQENGERWASLAYRQLAYNYQSQGIELDAGYGSAYNTVTGREWDLYGTDPATRAREEITNSEPFRVQYLAVMGNPEYANLNDDERTNVALENLAVQARADVMIEEASRGGQVRWEQGLSWAYEQSLDTGINAIMGAANASIGQGVMTTQSLSELRLQVRQMEASFPRPAHVTDAQWQPMQDRFDAMNKVLTDLGSISGSEAMQNYMNEVVINEFQQFGVPGWIMYNMYSRDPQAAQALIGNSELNNQLITGTQSLINSNGQPFFNITNQDSQVIVDSLGVPTVGDIPANTRLPTEAMDSMFPNTGATPDQVMGNLQVSGALANTVSPGRMGDPAFQDQFYSNSMNLAGSMYHSGDARLGSNLLRRTLGNQAWIGNFRDLTEVAPERARLLGASLRTVLEQERVKETTYLDEVLSARYGTVENNVIVFDADRFSSEKATFGPAASMSRFIRIMDDSYGNNLVAAMRDNFSAVPAELNMFTSVLNYDSRRITDAVASINEIDVLNSVIADPIEGPATSTITSTNSSINNPTSVTAQLLDRYEGAGDYNTLFGHSQSGGPFNGVQVSNMTIGEALDFASPNGAYGQWVRGQVGRVATPMGRFQIVGTTLRNAARDMGLSMDTPFNEDTQNAIFNHLARARVIGKSDSEARRGLRAEWEGFRAVPDAQLDQMIAEIRGGDVLFAPGSTYGGQGIRSNTSGELENLLPPTTRGPDTSVTQAPTQRVSEAPVVAESVLVETPTQLMAEAVQGTSPTPSVPPAVSNAIRSLISNLSEETPGVTEEQRAAIMEFLNASQ